MAEASYYINISTKNIWQRIPGTPIFYHTSKRGFVSFMAESILQNPKKYKRGEGIYDENPTITPQIKALAINIETLFLEQKYWVNTSDPRYNRQHAEKSREKLMKLLHTYLEE